MAFAINADITEHWDVTPPIDIAPMARGANNRSFTVHTADERYVLKYYLNSSMLDRLRFEHALLSALAAADLPFAVPAPLWTRSGRTLVTIEHPDSPRYLALFHHIPGQPAAFGSVPEARECGAALAMLDAALATVQLPPGIPIPSAFEPLAAIHARVPDPYASVQDLEESALLVELMRSGEAAWARATEAWTPQIIHGDAYPSNTLVHRGRVTAILDFEYSGLGHRAMDFAVGLAAFSTRDWYAGMAPPIVDAFAAGYLTRQPLMEDEIEALPTLLIMRELVSLIHWLGRTLEGLTTEEELQDRVQRCLALHRWLEWEGATLASRIARLNRP